MMMMMTVPSYIIIHSQSHTSIYDTVLLCCDSVAWGWYTVHSYRTRYMAHGLRHLTSRWKQLQYQREIAPLFLHGITYISNYSYYCHYHFYYHAMYMILSSYWSQIHYPPSWELIIKLFWNDSYCIYMLFPTIPYFIFFLRRHDLSFLDVLHQPNATAALFIQSRSPTDMRQHRLITTTFLHFN